MIGSVCYIDLLGFSYLTDHSDLENEYLPMDYVSKDIIRNDEIVEKAIEYGRRKYLK